MQVSREELLHIANLAELKIQENEIDNYLKNLEEILNFAEIVNTANVDNLNITISGIEEKNKFRKDEVQNFEDIDLLMQNAPEKEQNMFKIPKVL